MSITASLIGTVTAFPGALIDSRVEAPVQAIPTAHALSYLDIGNLVYACLPPTESWQPFRYANWFAERGIKLPKSALQVLNSDQGFEVTSNKSYLIAAIPTSRYEEPHRRMQNFEILSMRWHLREMKTEAVFWMLRSLVMSQLPDGVTWMVGMHAPIIVDGIPYRLNYSEDSEISECVARSETPINGYGALCFLSE